MLAEADNAAAGTLAQATASISLEPVLRPVRAEVRG
jgi:hypothetical protein